MFTYKKYKKLDYRRNCLQHVSGERSFRALAFVIIASLPDWVILSGLVIIGLILIKIFLDPCMAICHILRDSSLTITEKVSSAIIPAATVTRINRKGNLEIEDGNYMRKIEEKALEARIAEVEKRLNMFQTMVLKEKVREEGSIRCIEN